ncbi:crotonase/enoyl-CoA hydratase family protein [Herbiconiux sp. L3-i23]|uniref:crotonase/enoyl-CoA hydratase family protein n=1 Tax=Herbiconiux sp. L3-i23 TaxID=2905871 RepID=UPI002051FD6C|nr:crotonase/enoyl-CoA hydratase family protein [Herbiconiux sp. L3-i23]BDI23276.1 putative enoyl-CoA hydratase/isomerase [Herbiconiux sp. L3-i23]
MTPDDGRPRVVVERRGHVTLVGLDRPEKRNAADVRMLRELASAYGEFERDPEARVAVVHGVGDHFTGGLDLADIGPRMASSGGLDLVPDGGRDPWGLIGPDRTKPVVVAVQGTCLTLGVELILASEIAVAADSTRFGQIEVSRAILPFGGATLRFPRAVGWGDAMRWMLTGELFDAAEAHRIGLVSEVVPHGQQLDRALAIAARIAAQAPLAVQATLSNARLAVREGDAAAAARLGDELTRLAASEDAAIGMRAFLTRTDPDFVGR